MAKYVWYVGYGSNLDEDRFLCYLEKGTPFFSLLNTEKKREERKLWGSIENRECEIPHRLYFAWQEGEDYSKHWGSGGTAFLDFNKTQEKSEYSLCRIWKITEEQFTLVQTKEGKLYKHLLSLGEEEKLPVWTFTYGTKTQGAILTPYQPPSCSYLKTIARGLRETYGFDATAFADYMKDKEGIRGNINDEKLCEIFISIKDL